MGIFISRVFDFLMKGEEAKLLVSFEEKTETF